MKVLVVGGGGREHAICWALKKSPKVTELFCAPGNAGISAIATCVPIGATDLDAMVQWAKENAMDLVMVAPDDPLALGMVDAMEAAGIKAFGPRKNAAIIEASKAFSKELMAKYHIPTAKYKTFTDEAEALAYIDQEGAPIVVKADGLALGKGVTVAETVEEAKQAVRDMMEGGKFGASGLTVVIEEGMQHLNGEAALVYARTRQYADGDYTRTQHQRNLVQAIVNKVLSLPPTELPGVIQAAAQCVTTDLTVTDIISLAQQFQDNDSADGMTVYSAVIPSTAEYVNGISYVFADIDKLADMMETIDSGGNPDPNAEEESDSSES